MSEKAQWAGQIEMIRRLPEEIEPMVKQLRREQLDQPLRSGGWTLRQIVHHLVDSHVNMYIGMRLILTQDNPTLQSFDENSWAELPDAHRGGIAASLALLRGLHLRTVELLESLDEADFAKTSFHPEEGEMTFGDFVTEMAEHSVHHTRQIRDLLQNKRWLPKKRESGSGVV